MLTRRSSPSWTSYALRRISPLRSYSSAASPVDGTLPLAGIRVLDMTRVLAGVSLQAAIITTKLIDLLLTECAL